ncbi:MAG: phosphohydrolase [Candidatus Goldbacteria bacterium]|nr:phosphohydrolase [Candidatus Goldiibacteriota bacterium]
MELEKYKNEYNELLKKISYRKGVIELASYLEKHGYFSAPASTKYHLCIEGGLLIHSLNVTKLALKLKEILLPDISEESVILCSLFHDAHKVTDGFGNITYIKNEGYDKEKQPYIWNKDQMNFSGAQKSLLIISKFVDLTQDEMQAIAYHDGPFVPSWEDIKGDPYPLTLLLHFADMWSSWITEKQKDKNSFTKKFIQDL